MIRLSEFIHLSRSEMLDYLKKTGFTRSSIVGKSAIEALKILPIRLVTNEGKVRKKTMPYPISEIYWKGSEDDDLGNISKVRVGFCTFSTIRVICTVIVSFSALGVPYNVKIQTGRFIIKNDGTGVREEVNRISQAFKDYEDSRFL